MALHCTVGAFPAGIRRSLVAFMFCWSGGCPPRGGGFGARGGPAHVTLDGVGSILMFGCGTRATEVVRRGMMCGLCVLCGVADDRGQGQASVYGQSEWASGVRAGVVGRGRGNQPGDGGLCKLEGSALRRLFPRGSVGALSHACAACGGMVALRVAESLGER
jgi:hypothetical protein